jgi:DNA-binding PadR family transcriptional regulator
MAISRVEIVVLGLLAEEPLYGYQLLERFRERGMQHWAEVGRASVYQALHRLEREGHVAGKAQGRDDGPDRRVYRITRPGRDRLRAGMFERFSQAAPYESEAGAALGFSHVLGTDEARRGIAERQAALEEVRAAVAADRARLKGARGPGNALARRMLELQAALLSAERAWLAGLRRDAGRLRR